MRKKIFIFAILTVCLIALSGCTTTYRRSDVNKYIEDKIGIKNFKLSEKAIEKKEDDGYTDYYWHVEYNNIEFDVINNYRYGMESVTNGLESNYAEKVLDYFYSKYDKVNNITYKKDYVYKKNTLICEVANEQSVIDYAKLQKCYNNIVEFIKTIDFKEYPMNNISVAVTNSNKHVKWLSLYQDNNIKSFDDFKNQ